jgi:hypothetical protein
MMANASSGPFESTSPQCSHDALDAAKAAWANAVQRMENPVESIFRAFNAAIASMSSPNPEDSATGWLTVVSIDAMTATILWASGDEVWHLRDGAVIGRTFGHTMARKTGFASAPNVLTRGIGGPYSGDDCEPTREVWSLQSGDRLLILSPQAARFADETLVLATWKTDLESAASLLMSFPEASVQSPWAAALVAEV